MNLCLKAGLCLAAFCAALFFIVTAGTPTVSPVRATATAGALTPAAFVVRVQAAPQGLQVSGLLLPEPDRVPVQAQDRVYDLTPTLSNDGGERPLSWRALLAGPQAVHHA